MLQQEKNANEYYRQQNFAAALRCYLKVEQEEPAREDILLYIASCYDALGQKEFAARYYKKILKYNKKSDVAAADLAILYYEENETAAAEKYAKYAIKCNSQNVQALSLFGNIYYRQHKLDKALQYYLQALDVQRDYYTANYNAASIYFELKDYNTAYFYAKKTYQANPQNDEVKQLLGNICTELGKNSEAMQLFSDLYAKNPEDFWLCNQLSQVCQQEGEYDAALDLGWHAVLLSGGENSQQINFGYLLYETAVENNSEKVRQYAKDWLKKYPKNPLVQHMSAAICNSGDTGQMSSSYVREIFDAFAEDFEEVLGDLDYAVPGQMAKVMETLAENVKLPKLKILDAGCGTGLCSVYLKKYAKFRGLDGVDISQKMLDVARKKKVYTHLYQKDLMEFLQDHENEYDLINAADVFTYFGALNNLFALLFTSLKPDGRVLFSISENSLNDQDYFLHLSGRFLHSRKYVESLLTKQGFLIEKMNRTKLRNEGEKEVFGWIVMARK